jgi:NAD(P)-dependent dehydrogenase (short-subunit alcohol dehydrogenase family)
MHTATRPWRPDPELLAGRAALVAGGAGGIGAAVSRVLAASGASVAIADRDEAAGVALADEIERAGGRARPLVVDLFDEAACAALPAAACGALGQLDVLVNVAGGLKKHAPWGLVHEWTTAAWDAIFDLNLRYVFWLCRAAIPLMADGGGAIVNIASLNGVVGNPNQAAYGAAKAALINLTQTLAGECGPMGIRVNAVGPGVTVTEAVASTIPAAVQERLRAVTPLRRLGTPDDIARAVTFLASPMADFVTGQLLLVEGGVSVNYPYFAPGTFEF